MENAIYFEGNEIGFFSSEPKSLVEMAEIFPIAYHSDDNFIIHYEEGYETYNLLLYILFDVKASRGILYRICPECGHLNIISEMWKPYTRMGQFSGMLWLECGHALFKDIDGVFDI